MTVRITITPEAREHLDRLVAGTREHLERMLERKLETSRPEMGTTSIPQRPFLAEKTK